MRQQRHRWQPFQFAETPTDDARAPARPLAPSLGRFGPIPPSSWQPPTVSPDPYQFIMIEYLLQYATVERLYINLFKSTREAKAT